MAGVEVGEAKPVHVREPLFTSFASKLIAVLVTIILTMIGYWMHHITTMTTSNSNTVAAVQNEQARVTAELRMELRAISSQLSTLNAQVGALGEFTPKEGRLTK